MDKIKGKIMIFKERKKNYLYWFNCVISYVAAYILIHVEGGVIHHNIWSGLILIIPVLILNLLGTEIIYPTSKRKNTVKRQKGNSPSHKVGIQK